MIKSTGLAFAIACACLGVVPLAQAQGASAVAAEGVRNITIAAGELNAALEALVEQSGVQLLYDSKLVEGVKTLGVINAQSAQAAVDSLLRGTLLTSRVDASGAILIVSTQAGASTDIGALQEILVSGSRLLNMDLVRTQDDAQPYYIAGREAIEQSAALNVEDFLKQRMSMNTTAATNGQRATNFLGSTSSINLRGLGTNQTLVLIDGRRTIGPANFGATNQADINGIPMATIERIEVLPSTAGAIYGGSAVGGAVNVILKRDYDGGDVSVNYENTTDGSAPIRSIDAGYGTSFEDGRTQVMVGVHLAKTDALYNRDRPELMANGIATVMANNPSLLYSARSPFFVGTTPNIASANGSNLVLRDGTPLGSALTYVPSGYVAGSNPSSLVSNAGSQNVQLANVVAQPTGLGAPIGGAPEVKSYLATVRREMTDRLELFGEFFSSSTESNYDYNPFSYALTVPATAPTNPFQQAVLVSFPSSVSVPFDTETSNMRAVAGALLRLPGDWAAEFDYTYNRSKIEYRSTTFASTAFNAALASGAINPFQDTLAQPLNLTPYLQGYGYDAVSDLHNAALRFSGPLPQFLPAGAPTLAIGLEYRKEGNGDGTFSRRSDNFPAEDDVRLYLGHSQSIKSLYAEAKFPLLADVKGAQLLDLQLALRTERYSVGTGTLFQYVVGSNVAYNTPVVFENIEYTSTNPTIGLRYQPIDSIMFRASYGTGFLPPSYAQLQPSIPDARFATINVIDPLRGNAITPVGYLSGGNANLKPQDSKNWNFGVVFTPSFLDGVRIGLEWYRIVQEDVIYTPGAQAIVDLENSYPGRVTRAAVQPGDPYGVGAITFVDYTLLNANELRTQGFDMSLDWRIPTERYGDFSVGLQGTLIDYYKTQSSPTAALEDLTDQIARNGPLGKRGSASLRWDYGRWAAGWSASYFGSYQQYRTLTNNAYVQAQGSRSIASQIYHDLFMQFRPAQKGEGGLLSGTKLQFGIKNVFDKTPPFDAYYPTISNYYSVFGNARLRSYWFSAAKEF